MWQTGICEFEAADVVEKEKQRLPKEFKIRLAANMIRESQRPYIYIGGGAITAKASQEIEELADCIDAPIGSTLMGLSAISHENPRFLGMEGMHGHYASSMAQNEADLILAVGARFSDRATGNVSKYAKKAKIIHIDIDRAEVDKNIASDLGIGGDLKIALQELLKIVEPKKNLEWDQRLDELRREEQEQFQKNCSDDLLEPYALIHEVQNTQIRICLL